MTEAWGHDASAEARAFKRNLTVILVLLALLSAGSVMLFGLLLFKSLSKSVTEDAIFQSKLDAERIARGIAERSAGDPYILKLKQREIDSYVGSALSERRVLNEVRVEDKSGKLLYSYQSLVRRPEEPALKGGDPEKGTVVPASPSSPLVPNERSQETTVPISDPYNIEVDVGDFGVLRVGVSRRELQLRVEKLRSQLYQKTFVAAAVSLLTILAASIAVGYLVRRTRSIEAARLEAERRAELGEVAAGLAHEIRNPLNAMSLNLELLEEQLQKAAKAQDPALAGELALAARQETARLSRLLSDFLSYARPSPLSPVASDLNEPAQEAVAFLKPEADKRGIKLDFTPHQGGAPALLDTQRVKQVVMNLVGNALDAVEAEGAWAREVHVRVSEEGAFWKLTVTDRGPGIPKAKHSEIFKVFVSTKPAGTGLGLPIADRIVRGHGGTLALVCQAGEPTRAVATFPKST